MTKVFVGCPLYSKLDHRAFPSLATPSLLHPTAVQLWPSSLLGQAFNELFCECVNDPSYTHFALHHADVMTTHGWVDTMLEEMETHALDVISAIVPIKDNRGLTSTGYRTRDNPCVNRLTMYQAMRLPETITHNPDRHYDFLAVNTGLMVCKLGEWVRWFPGFNVSTSIVWEDGKTWAANTPEDWAFSAWAHGYGLKVGATRKVPVSHVGDAEYPNTHEWGRWQCDEKYREIMQKRAQVGG